MNPVRLFVVTAGLLAGLSAAAQPQQPGVGIRVNVVGRADSTFLRVLDAARSIGYSLVSTDTAGMSATVQSPDSVSIRATVLAAGDSAQVTFLSLPGPPQVQSLRALFPLAAAFRSHVQRPNHDL